MSERHTMVLRWEGDASLEERLVECAQEHHAEVNRSENGGLACLTLTLEANGLQELRDAVDGLLVALSNVEESSL
ncbi:MAG: hypothetical protein DWC07_00435 [Candidatus Poseidoniales archaeon]|nr:MAG: hypothetical protein DWC07_00435 [Candidatus Poseidoniales archaeon]